MDTEHIMKIIDLMKESDLSEFEIEQDGLKLRICRGAKGNIAVSPAVMAPSLESTAPAASNNNSGEDEAGIEYVKSPMVGTFYAASSPDAAPFVNTGDRVNNDSVVCILEAMKVMNEIQAEINGTIVEVLAENGQTIEFGQPLFKIKVG